MKNKKTLLLIAVAALLAACAESVDVTGGTTNTLDVSTKSCQIGVLTGSICVRTVYGDTIDTAACMLDSARPPAAIYDIAGLFAERDQAVNPLTVEELGFMGL